MYREEPSAATVLVAAADGKVLGLDRATGTVLWGHDLGAGTVELVLTDSMVIACTSAQLWCIDYPSGRRIGAVMLPFPGRPSLLVDGQFIYVGAGGQVSCYSLQGVPLWTRTLTPGAARVAVGLPGHVRQVDEA